MTMQSATMHLSHTHTHNTHNTHTHIYTHTHTHTLTHFHISTICHNVSLSLTHTHTHTHKAGVGWWGCLRRVVWSLVSGLPHLFLLLLLWVSYDCSKSLVFGQY